MIDCDDWHRGQLEAAKQWIQGQAESKKESRQAVFANGGHQQTEEINQWSPADPESAANEKYPGHANAANHGAIPRHFAD